ncbi:MAG: TetR/AcrR family transcriptional regulator [Proteobacteria bacterium]|nr:TetR/AcrR family transcriptional regulator [Pseudomonadota bacterium]
MPRTAVKSAGPGRPKDQNKRAAILDAAKRLFVAHGYTDTSMDAVAAAARVSKLTVYSHFGDKDALFAEAVRCKCEEQLPAQIFLADLKGPLRGQLVEIARAFYALVTSDDAMAVHRTVIANVRNTPKLGQVFWEAGPARVQAAFDAFLRDEVAAGKLDIADTRRAATQFFCLLKGESHARMEFGCCATLSPRDIHEHIEATVEMFLRAYAPR